ncbi:hypothetical protein Pla100_56110 [Neorhodopirellula pilleata]|uniref:Uncharacterized protein n=1 Tax=Neorhodopirellula pilleata TaxID=2714738 RepID=A0A5C5ZP90_9BACT|nr:hypothetical protein Pla100_56110 [Neorhodopirellula pilleata]
MINRGCQGSVVGLHQCPNDHFLDESTIHSKLPVFGSSLALRQNLISALAERVSGLLL